MVSPIPAMEPLAQLGAIDVAVLLHAAPEAGGPINAVVLGCGEATIAHTRWSLALVRSNRDPNDVALRLGTIAGVYALDPTLGVTSTSALADYFRELGSAAPEDDQIVVFPPTPQRDGSQFWVAFSNAFGVR